MKMAEVTAWVEAHPGESIVIGGGGLILILWLLGFFSSSQAAPSQDPLAAAYYAAEAQQAVVGGQIQMANINATASTAQDTINANAAQAIASTNANAAQIINGQNTGAAQTINQQSVDAAATINAQNTYAQTQVAGMQAGVLTAIGADQLQATAINANAATTINASNNAANEQLWKTQQDTILGSAYINNIMAPETMGAPVEPSGIFRVSGQDVVSITGAPAGGTPSYYSAAGYTPAQIANIFGQGFAYPQVSPGATTGVWPNSGG